LFNIDPPGRSKLATAGRIDIPDHVATHGQDIDGGIADLDPQIFDGIGS
jgi:hypothetical protein